MVIDSALLQFPPRLIANLANAGPIAAAFSGGIDSRFLCHAALLCDLDIIALHASGPHISREESAFARSWAKKRNLRLIEFEVDPFKHADVANNSRARCYACKSELLKALKEALLAAGEEHRAICDGSNADDDKSFRPGQKALREAGVCSPLAFLPKNEIRRLAYSTNLDWPDQAARPCLLTRFAYDQPVAIDALQRIAACEAELGQILADSKTSLRLRFLPQPVLHLDQTPGKLLEPLQKILDKHGFTDCSIQILPDLSGFFDRNA